MRLALAACALAVLCLPATAAADLADETALAERYAPVVRRRRSAATQSRTRRGIERVAPGQRRTRRRDMRIRNELPDEASADTLPAEIRVSI
jgi:hypothetical protein